MDNKLYIRKVTVTRVFYETAISAAPQYIRTDNIKSREIPKSKKMLVNEHWREATESEAILAGFVEGNYIHVQDASAED